MDISSLFDRAKRPLRGSGIRWRAVLGRVWLPVLALTIIAGWAIFVGRDYLYFNPDVVPAGREYGSAIQAHHLWTRFQECGWCALWDGSERGGFPAFVDPLASSLHPLVIATTLLYGVVNGSKAALIAALGLAGLAQWWLGHELKLGWPARLWGALMVMVGGHLAGRMELGIFSVVLSTAMVSFTFPAALRLARTGRRRDAVLMGVVMALLAVSGQGYMQAGFVAMLPAYVFLFPGRENVKRLLARFVLAAELAILLAAPFLVPFLHFFPNFVKDADPAFRAAQPLPYYLLNLFIDDVDFLFSTQLGKLPYPHLYTMFIGWIPVLLALLCLRLGRRRDRERLLFLAASAGLAIFVGSMLPLQWLQPLLPFLSGLRFAPMIGGLALPPLVGLAAYALDRLLQAGWPQPRIYLGLGNTAPAGWRLNLKWLLVLPLALALWRGYRFSQQWLYVQPLSNEVDAVLEDLEGDELRWVQPPFGEHEFIEPAVRRGLKLSPGIMTWRWKEREFPPAVLEANRRGPPPSSERVGDAGGIPLYARNVQAYATAITTQGRQPCTATGTGGWIDVTCETETEGVLVVAENNWSGWRAWRDGERVRLQNSQWLKVDAPAGAHTYRFRYLPWDVPLGLLLFAAGCVLCVHFWRYDEHPEETNGH